MESLGTIERFVAGHSTIFNLVSLAVGIAGLVFAILFYRLSKPVRRLAVATRTFPVVPERAARVRGLEMAFRGQHVSMLSVTRLAVWNAGTESIRASDIPDSETLRLTARDGITILAAEVLEVTRAVNRLSISAVQSVDAPPSISFDFLDPGDGALIDVIHDGIGREDVALVGTIVGGTIRRTTSDPETVPLEGSASRAKTQSGRRNAQSASAIFAVFGLFIAGLAFIMVEGRAVLAGLSALTVMIGIGLYAYSRRVYPPPSIRHFDSDL